MGTCLVIPVAPDEEEQDVTLTVNSFKRFVPNATVFFGVDEDYDNTWLGKYGSVVRVKGFGVGKALNAAVIEALKDNCEFIVKADSHNYFESFEYPLWLEIADHYTYEGTHWGATTAEWPTMDWVFTWGEKPLIPQTAVPVHAYPSVIAQVMLREFGCVYCVPYWGPELYDFTLTACRRYGWCARQGKWLVKHKHKSTWPTSRINRQFPSEPWMSEVTGNPYFTSMEIAWQIYIARHVRDPTRHPKYNQRLFEIAKKYYGDVMRYVPGYSVEFIYDKLGIPIKQRINA